MKLFFQKKIFILILLPCLIKNSFLELNLLKNPLLYKSHYVMINESINNFLTKFTDFNLSVPEFKDCLSDLSYNNLRYMYIYSGKGLAEQGLEYECISNENFTYYFLIYNRYFNKSDDEIYQFINKTSFYTGICIPNNCTKCIDMLLNNSYTTFFENLKNEWSLENISFEKIEEISNSKNNDKNILIIIIIIFVIFAFLIIQILFYFLYNCVYTTHAKEKIINREEEYMNQSNEIFNKKIPLIAKNEEKKSFCYLIFSNLNVGNFLQILIKKKNDIYDETNLEFIAFLRFIIIFSLTFIQNIYVLIQIPSKDFFEKEFYQNPLFFIIKFSSFSLDIYISIEGFIMIFKLLSYIKKNVYKKNKNNISFSVFFFFFYHSLYKVISTFLLYYIVGCNQINLISFFSSGFLHLYYKKMVANEKYDNDFIKIFFPMTSISPYIYNFEESFYSYHTYIILYFNEYFIFLFSLLIIFILFKLKKKIYDIIIFIIIILSFLLTILIKVKEDENQDKTNSNLNYYNFEKIINVMYSIKYPHLMLNNYFFGIFSGIICFSLKDFISNISIVQSENKYIPFEFLFDIFRCFGLISDAIKIIFILIFVIILIFLSFSFYFLQLLNGKFLFEFDLKEEIVYYYERPLIILFFNLIIIFVYSIDYNISKRSNFFNFFIFFSRIDFSFFLTVSKFIYSLYCLYNFQLKLSYQNLFIISFGLFMNLLLFNFILTITLVLPLKLLFKKIIS